MTVASYTVEALARAPANAKEVAGNAEFGFEQLASGSMAGMNGAVRSLRPEVANELVRIGGEAHEWRRQAGLTQRALEALTGIDQTTISKFERGKLPGLRVHHIARIRLACRTARRVDSTFGGSQQTRPQPTRREPSRDEPTRPEPTRSQWSSKTMTPESSQAGVDADAARKLPSKPGGNENPAQKPGVERCSRSPITTIPTNATQNSIG